MDTSGKYEDLKKAAAEARHRSHKNTVVDYHGLASIRPVKITSPAKEAERKRNREKHAAIMKWVTEVNSARQEHVSNWNTPTDWRIVTEKTIHRYIPFEQKNIQLSEAVRYMTERFAQYEKPRNTRTVVNEDTPLWYLSRNQLRKALYKASIRRAKASTN